MATCSDPDSGADPNGIAASTNVPYNDFISSRHETVSVTPYLASTPATTSLVSIVGSPISTRTFDSSMIAADSRFCFNCNATNPPSAAPSIPPTTLETDLAPSGATVARADEPVSPSAATAAAPTTYTPTVGSALSADCRPSI